MRRRTQKAVFAAFNKRKGITMNNYLEPHLTDELREISTLALAHIGDSVFELMVRTHLCINGVWTAERLHKHSVEYVSAKSQAAAAEKLLLMFDDEEMEIYKRGRNTHSGQTPKSSTQEQYNAATGLETLFGYLYLNGRNKRLNELFSVVIQRD